MKQRSILTAARVFKRQAVIHSILGPGMNRGPLGATLAFKTDGDDADPAVLEDVEFQQKVIGGVDTLTKSVEKQGNRIEKLLGDFDRLDKETKKDFDELTNVKKSFNGLSSEVQAATQKLTLIQSRLENQARASFGNPIEKIIHDEELRWRFNALVRLSVNKDGDMENMVKKDFPDFIKKALGEDSSPGSTLINQQLVGEIYHTLESYGIWNTFRVTRLGTKTNILPVKTARAVALAIISEGTQITDDANKAGTTVTATVVDIAALLNVYFRLLQDAEFDVTADVLDDFAEATAYRLDWFATQADGGADTTDGGMTGIFGGGGTAANAAAGNTTVETTDEEDWRRCLLTVDPAVLQRPARWWMHPQILVRALSVKDDNGRSIFLTALEAPSAKAIGSMFGYPITLGAVCPTTNAANAKVAAFGDPNGQVVGIRNDFDVQTSDHHKWDYYQRSFRIVGRAATKIRRATAFAVLTLPAA
jgi:HK97 family phage major capsid protein